MRLALLGPVELIDPEGIRIELPSRRQRQLLVVLGLSRGRVVEVERIAELIWGDQPPRDPAGTVHTNVSRLRRMLGDPLSIDTEAHGYALSCPEEHLDLGRYESLVTRLRAEPIEHRPALATEALDLWRGTPLADLDHPDVEAERQRLIDLRLEAAEVLADSFLELGRSAEAIAAAEQLVHSHPYREHPVGTLMRALYATGRQADALGAFADLRRRLLDDLGVDPSIDLRNLEMAILAQTLIVPTARGAGEPSGPPDTAAHGEPAEVGVGPAATAPPATDPTTTGTRQRIQLCTTPDGTMLAYAFSGTGPPLVKAANWMTHLDYDWESPVWRHWNTGLSRQHTLVRYDERGCGLSDWEVERFTFDAWVDDLASVIDAMGLDRFPLLGVSQGGAVAIAYAVRHPERVSRLVLFGAYARGRGVRAATPEAQREADLHLELARVGWGTDEPTFRQVFTAQFMPEGTREQWEAFNELQRRTCSPENAVRFMEVFAGIDVTDLAPRVSCPTLVMHARNEIRVPFTNARELAALIPDSELVPLESRNHILTETEPAWERFLAETGAFLADDR